MTLEQAIVIIEDSEARTEMIYKWIHGKNKEDRIRQDEHKKTARLIIKMMKELSEQEFMDRDDWFKLKEN